MSQGGLPRMLFGALLLAGIVAALFTVSAPESLPVGPGSGAVAAPDAHAARVGEAVLRAGGNAVDAAVAVAFALAVTYPVAGNIGGGGFILIRHEGKHYLVDARERAPLQASRDMYLDERKEVVEGKSLYGAFSIGVPGSVSGLWLAHRRFGKLEWSKLVVPAIELAEKGFDADKDLEQDVASSMRDFKAAKFETNFEKYFGGVKAGRPLVQRELAETLRRIAREGADGFYKGRTAELIVQQVKRFGGLITQDDLAGYEAKWREPLNAKFPGLGLEIYTTPPPSSGGVALIQMLRMAEAKLDRAAAHNSKEYIHFVAEVEKRVFADRAQFLGDPDFVKVPVDRLTEAGYCRRRIETFDAGRITPTESVKAGLESSETTHYSILDADGNAVSHTTTLNSGFGSGVVVEGAGFLLNDEMDDFSAKPGVPNLYGVIGAEANAIAPGKRMLSSMSPTMAYAAGRELILGTPGGPTIFTSNFQIVLNVFHFRKPLAEAMAAPRFHHQLFPKDQIDYENGREPAKDVLSALESLGYKLRRRPSIGDEHAILVETGGDAARVDAQSDPRGIGKSVVVPREK
ncbi:MAG TPA: gamma-glutamyltransferase [Planctomycetota bacterium]|nr:gamma-glutamyltransferase [Planctomycetota bacterium]